MHPAVLALALASGMDDAAPPPWSRVGQVVSTHCTPCHREGGGAPFALRDERDLARRADTIVRALDEARMPPWTVDACAAAPIGGEIALDEDDRDALRAWLRIARDRPIDPERARPVPVSSGAPAATGTTGPRSRTLVLEAAEAFDVPAEGFEILRTFALPFSLDAPAGVRRVRLVPEPPELVRQAFLLVDRTGTGVMLDDADPGGGYDAPADMALDFAGDFGGWRLGDPDHVLPDDLARALPTEGAVLVGVHLHPVGRTVPFRVRLELELVEAPRRPVLAVPCGDLRVDIPAGDAAHEIAAEWTVPVASLLVEITPHGGRLCTAFRLEAIAPATDGPPAVLTLLHVSPWDPAWHATVALQHAVALSAGTRVRATWRYDNTLANPWHPCDPPRAAGLGHGPGEETPVVLLHLAPRDPADAGALEQGKREAALAMMRARLDWLGSR